MKYVPGPFVGQLSGSQGNTTAAHNRFGSYLRNRVIPVNPNTAAQTQQRDVLAALASAWRTLTDQQRLDWKALADQWQRIDSQGQPYFLTGIQAYIALNRYRELAGQAFAATAPALENPPELTSVALTVAVTGSQFDVAYAPALSIGERYMVFATPGLSPGVNFVPRSKFRLLSVGSDPTDLDLFTEWTNVFGPLTAGEKIFIRMLTLSSAFFPSAEVRASAIVGA